MTARIARTARAAERAAQEERAPRAWAVLGIERRLDAVCTIRQFFPDDQLEFYSRKETSYWLVRCEFDKLPAIVREFLYNYIDLEAPNAEFCASLFPQKLRVVS